MNEHPQNELPESIIEATAAEEQSAWDKLHQMPVVTTEEVMRFRSAALVIAKENSSLKQDLWVAETALESARIIFTQRAQQAEDQSDLLRIQLKKEELRNECLSAALNGAQDNFEQRLKAIREGAAT